MVRKLHRCPIVMVGSVYLGITSHQIQIVDESTRASKSFQFEAPHKKLAIWIRFGQSQINPLNGSSQWQSDLKPLKTPTIICVTFFYQWGHDFSFPKSKIIL